MPGPPMDHDRAVPRRQEGLGIGVDGPTMRGAVSRCTEAVERGAYLSVGVVNAAKVVAMRRDERLRDAVSGCCMVLADGQAGVWAGRLLGSPLPERVAGIDLFQELLGQAARRGYRVYLLGARPDVLPRTMAEAVRRYPGLIVAGASDGYFPADEASAVAAKIRRLGPDMVFLGMSSPRKELFLSEWGASKPAGQRRARRGRLVRHPRRAHPEGPGLVPGPRAGVAVPGVAGARAPRPQVAHHARRVPCTGTPRD